MKLWPFRLHLLVFVSRYPSWLKFVKGSSFKLNSSCEDLVFSRMKSWKSILLFMFHLEYLALEVAALLGPWLHLVSHRLNLVRHHFNFVRHHFKVLKCENLGRRILLKRFCFYKWSPAWGGVIVKEFTFLSLYIIINWDWIFLFLMVLIIRNLKLLFQTFLKLRTMNHFQHQWKLEDCKKSSDLCETLN